MWTSPRRSLSFVVLLTVTLVLSGCSGGKKWYWPFGSSKADSDPAHALTDPAAGYTGTYVDPQYDTPEVPPIATYTPPPAPDTLPFEPGGIVAHDASGSIPAAPEIRRPSVLASELKTIHFGFDRSDLTPDSRRVLDENAEWLLQHPGIQVQIEGHCDERGTVEYNLALGQRRAESVREYLVSKGIDANTLHTISYGKERPLAFGTTEADHAMNRRAQFLVFTD